MSSRPGVHIYQRSNNAKIDAADVPLPPPHLLVLTLTALHVQLAADAQTDPSSTISR